MQKQPWPTHHCLPSSVANCKCRLRIRFNSFISPPWTASSRNGKQFWPSLVFRIETHLNANFLFPQLPSSDVHFCSPLLSLQYCQHLLVFPAFINPKPWNVHCPIHLLQLSQRTHGVEYLDSFNAFSSKQKLQKALVKLELGFVWERARNTWNNIDQST